MFTEIILFSVLRVWMFFIFCHDHEGLSFMTFVRNPLYPKGNNESKDERFWYLTFCVALFLIHSIWEQVPNNMIAAGNTLSDLFLWYGLDL
jgi:hypothetical protein